MDLKDTKIKKQCANQDLINYILFPSFVKTKVLNSDYRITVKRLKKKTIVNSVAIAKAILHRVILFKKLYFIFLLVINII